MGAAPGRSEIDQDQVSTEEPRWPILSCPPVRCPAAAPIVRRLRSAVTTVVRSVTVAAGVFAPGHLGELTRQVPFELVDAVLEQTRATERRLRILPSRVGVYFVVALALFPGWARRRCGRN